MQLLFHQYRGEQGPPSPVQEPLQIPTGHPEMACAGLVGIELSYFLVATLKYVS